jgi:hypothetical protein
LGPREIWKQLISIKVIDLSVHTHVFVDESVKPKDVCGVFEKTILDSFIACFGRKG